MGPSRRIAGAYCCALTSTIEVGDDYVLVVRQRWFWHWTIQDTDWQGHTCAFVTPPRDIAPIRGSYCECHVGLSCTLSALYYGSFFQNSTTHYKATLVKHSLALWLHRPHRPAWPYRVSLIHTAIGSLFALSLPEQVSTRGDCRSSRHRNRPYCLQWPIITEA